VRVTVAVLGMGVADGAMVAVGGVVGVEDGAVVAASVWVGKAVGDGVAVGPQAARVTRIRIERAIRFSIVSFLQLVMIPYKFKFENNNS
jgi:hypothetical protein